MLITDNSSINVSDSKVKLRNSNFLFVLNENLFLELNLNFSKSISEKNGLIKKSRFFSFNTNSLCFISPLTEKSSLSFFNDIFSNYLELI